jgi:diketogulonate reductase-like aldo/keto reductase
MSKIPWIVLRNGIKMQMMGVGTYKVDTAKPMDEVIRKSVAVGFRCVDTAHRYHNEKQVGHSIRNCGVPRGELFLTTKIWNEDHGYKKTLEAYERSRALLGTEIDMLMIHWPCLMNGLYGETWRAIQELYQCGKVGAVGVSNFTIGHLEALKKLGGEQPMVNQIEMHPSFIQEPMLDYCRENGIQVAAWSALLRGDKQIFESETVRRLAEKYTKSAGQVILRYLTQLGAMVIVKASSEEHIRENAEVFSFDLTDRDLDELRNLNTGKRVFQDPDYYYL